MRSRFTASLAVGLLASVLVAALLPSGSSSTRLWITHPPRVFTVCASADCGPNAVTLNWGTIQFSGRTGYFVYLNGTQVADVTPSKYTFYGLDCGTTFTFGVRAHNNVGGTSGLVSTSYTSPACTGASAPTNISLPLVTGTPTQGQTLSTTNGTWSGSPTSFAYQWQRCTITCANIAAATASSYVLALADVGATIQATVTATNATGSTPATSARTATIAGSGGTSCTQTVSTAAALTSAVSTAAGGDTICVSNGSYAAMTWTGGGSRSSQVTVQPAQGATVTFTGALLENSSYVNVQNIGMAGQRWEVDGPTRNVTFTNITAGSFEILATTTSTQNISVIGGSYGPWHSYPDNWIVSEGDNTTATNQNVLFDHVTIHDITETSAQLAGGTHFECIQAWAANGLTIRNSTFVNCSDEDLFIQRGGSDTAPTPTPAPSNILLENNTFDCCTLSDTGRQSGTSVQIATDHSELAWNNVVIRNNSSDSPMLLGTGGTHATTWSGVDYENNIAPSLTFNQPAGAGTGKPSGASVDYNEWFSGSAIGTHDLSGSTTSALFTNCCTFGGALDFTLKSTSPAIDAGNPAFYPAADIVGQARPLGNAPDIGAYEFWTGTIRYVSTGGSDSNTCTLAAPCASFNRAYTLASPGDIVQVAAGTYNTPWTDTGGASGTGELIAYDASKQSANADVTFLPAPGATVRVSDTIRVASSHVAFDGMSLGTGLPTPPNQGDAVAEAYDPVGVYPGHSTGHIAFVNMTGRNFEVNASNNVSILGGSYGPAAACSHALPGLPQYGGGNNALRTESGAGDPSNIIISGVTVHEVKSYQTIDGQDCDPNVAGTQPAQHTEGVALFSCASGCLINADKFYGNDVYDLLAQDQPDALGAYTITNNWFGPSTAPNGGVGAGSASLALDSHPANSVVANNSMGQNWNPDDTGTNPNPANFKIWGNIGIMDFGGYCPAAMQTAGDFKYNVWTNSSCAATDTNTGTAVPFANTANDATMDYTLTGGAAKDKVPLASQLTINDFAGNLRPLPAGAANVDAGASEIP